MTVQNLLSALQRKGVRLWMEEGLLRYEAPSGVMTVRDLEQIRARKQEIAALASSLRRNVAATNSLVAAARRNPLPLSFAQERLWFLHQMGMAGAAYNMPWALRLEGPLDASALKASLTELVRRHEILRTRFDAVNGEGAQVIDPPAEFALELVDLSLPFPGAFASAPAARSSPVGDDAPHHLRCVVEKRGDTRARRDLRSFRARPSVPVAGPACAVWRLLDMAAAAASGRDSRTPAGVLAQAAQRGSAEPLPAD
jgi:hypothetical protein